MIINNTVNGFKIDVFFNQIKFTGTGHALTLSGKFIRVVGNNISTYDDENADSALKVEGVADSTNGNYIDIQTIHAYSNAIDIDCSNGYVNYNVFNSRNIYSRYGNCFYMHGDTSNLYNYEENEFNCKLMACPNGYAVYNDDLKGGYRNRFYNMRCENQVANIVFGTATLYNCRTVECMDQKENDITKGNVFTLQSGRMGQNVKTFGTYIDLEALNLENADSYDDRIDLLKTTYAEGKTKKQAFDRAFYQCGNSFDSYVVGRCHRYICDDVSSIIQQGIYYILSPGTLFAYYDKKGFIPDSRVVRKINEATYYPYKKSFPTDMVLESSSTIYLDDSYCCIGIKEFTITQTASYKAIVYDKNNNKIFDGTNLEAGVYKFTCRFVPLESLVVAIPNGSDLVYGELEISHLYTGDNEEWIIEKINIVD